MVSMINIISSFGALARPIFVVASIVIPRLCTCLCVILKWY